MPILKFFVQLKIYNKIENSISNRILIILNKFKRTDCFKNIIRVLPEIKLAWVSFIIVTKSMH